MPKLTSEPACATVAARPMAPMKASISPMVWSAGISSINGSGSVSVSVSAAMQAAIARFEGRSRIAGPLPLGFGLRERNHRTLNDE